MDIRRPLFATLLTLSVIAPLGAAQASELSANYSAPALGSDMWTGYMARTGMFVPHYDDCDTASEAFVAVAPDGKGFCMDVNERASAYWEDARDDCMQEGKRLPEPGEFRYACRRAATLGLSGMNNANREWASNFAQAMTWDTNNGFGVVVPHMGKNSCSHGSWGHVAWSDNTVTSNTYRCVR